MEINLFSTYSFFEWVYLVNIFGLKNSKISNLF